MEDLDIGKIHPDYAPRMVAQLTKSVKRDNHIGAKSLLFAYALRNFAVSVGYSRDDVKYHKDENNNPIISFEAGSFELTGTGDVRTEFGWAKLTDHGLPKGEKFWGEAINSFQIGFFE